ncbi:hypothetical protein VTK73DRAFT_3757 [Phialemonium thermophilum]|uniref:DUF7721 domain-containing protein n=1 Tax=Phialemonium thermophilum TaxID=223376 RepID=A0ABR3VG80_9PEZI
MTANMGKSAPCQLGPSTGIARQSTSGRSGYRRYKRDRAILAGRDKVTSIPYLPATRTTMFGREDREDRDYRDQRSDYGRGDGYPAGGNVTHGGGYPAGAGVPRPDDDDFRGAAEVASRHAGDSGDSGLFGSILSSLSQNKHQVAQGDIDEDGRRNGAGTGPIRFVEC